MAIGDGRLLSARVAGNTFDARAELAEGRMHIYSIQLRYSLGRFPNSVSTGLSRTTCNGGRVAPLSYCYRGPFGTSVMRFRAGARPNQ